MRELPEPYRSLPLQYVEYGEYVSEEIDLFTRDQVLAIQKQAYEDGLRDAIPEGYVLAPIEPTKAMIEAYLALNGRFQSARSDWSAMLTASKKEPQ